MGDIGTVMIVGLFVMFILGVPIAITLGLLPAVGVWMADSNLMLLVLGAVMDNISAMVILSTVLIDLDPIQLGAMVVINFAVGMVTPPVGHSIFVASSISGMRVETIARHIWPFLLVLLGVVGLIAYVPAVTLWLPGFYD